LVGIIITGVLICFSIVGAIIGIPQLISEMRLKDSADELARHAYEPHPQLLEQALTFQQKLFFAFIGAGILSIKTNQKGRCLSCLFENY
jgi:hypothetical protein